MWNRPVAPSWATYHTRRLSEGREGETTQTKIRSFLAL